MNKRLETLADRSKPILDLVNSLAEAWSYDLASRKPKVAYLDKDGEPVTDLDLACYLAALVQHRAVINLPVYHGARAKSRTEGEVVVSSANRHGRTIELRSNQTAWSFSVSIEDANVMTADAVGKPRTFMVQGLDGDWHDGWETIEVMPQGLAKDVFEALCGSDNKMRFDYFIHPLRWTSVFGEDFRVAKFAADYRIADQVKFLKSEIKRLREALKIEVEAWPRSESEPSRPKLVWAYESFIDGVALHGDYTPYPTTQDGYKDACALKSRLEQLQKVLRFHVRASEYAWWGIMQKHLPAYQMKKDAYVVDKQGDRILLDTPILWVKGDAVNTLPKPSWAKSDWMQGVGDPAKPKGRNRYAAMEMEPGVTYRFRVMQSTEQVAA